MTDSIPYKSRLLDYADLINDPLIQAARVAPYWSMEEIRKQFGDEVVKELHDNGALKEGIGTHQVTQAIWYDTEDIENGAPMVGKSIRQADGTWLFMRSIGPRDHKDTRLNCPLGKEWRIAVAHFPKKRGTKRFKFYFDDTGKKPRKVQFQIAELVISPDLASHMQSEDEKTYTASWSISASKMTSSKKVSLEDIATLMKEDTFFHALDYAFAAYVRTSAGDHRDSGITYHVTVDREGNSYDSPVSS